MRKEEWKIIEGYDNYMVSNLGRVKNIKTGLLLKPNTNKDGYLYVTIFSNKKPKSFTIHRLVAVAFIPNPYNLPQVNHKDEDKTNNCVDNLEWCDSKYNINYGTSLKRRAESQKNDHRSKPVEMFSLEWVKEGEFISINEASRQTGIDKGNICNNCIGRCKSVGGHIFRYKKSEALISSDSEV